LILWLEMGNASSDAKRYREGYPGELDNARENSNLEFYSNSRKSKPDGDFIDNIHEKWWGNYNKLEQHHGYIQWLFPIREEGMNHLATKLYPHEAKAIANDPQMLNRVIKSYELMLDFYGMKLADRTTGKIVRGDNWKERYLNLNRSFHNYLRITRILKCLGEMSLEHFKVHFIEHCLNEITNHKELINCSESCVKYWLEVLKDKNERERMMEKVVADPKLRRFHKGFNEEEKKIIGQKGKEEERKGKEEEKNGSNLENENETIHDHKAGNEKKEEPKISSSTEIQEEEKIPTDKVQDQIKTEVPSATEKGEVVPSTTEDKEKEGAIQDQTTVELSSTTEKSEEQQVTVPLTETREEQEIQDQIKVNPSSTTESSTTETTEEKEVNAQKHDVEDLSTTKTTEDEAKELVTP